MAAASALRLWALDTQPGGLYPDEAAEAYDAHRLLHDPGFRPVFFQADAGREALYGYLVAVAFRVGGESTSVLRGTSAVLGVLAVVALYLWLRRRGPAVALGGAAWAAGSLWLVCISRDGMRNVLVPVVGALALWGMSAWAEKPSRNRALLAGALMAVGLWTYQPLKLLPVLFVWWVLWLRWRDPRGWTAMRPLLGWVALAYVVAGAPMLYTAATDPGHYFGRAVAVTAGEQAASGPGRVDHTIRTLLMFPLTGDPNPRHNVNGLPLLGVPLTALAVAGGSAAWRRRNEPLDSLLLVSLPVFLVPPLVATADAAPHFLRSLGLAAPLAGLVGMGAAETLRLARGFIPAPSAVAGLALVLAGLAGGTGAAYFSRPVGARYDAYSFNLVQLADTASAARGVVLLDDYRASDVRFLDWKAIESGRLVITDPSPAAAHPRPRCRGTVFALTREDIGQVYGGAVASGATVVARDPGGKASVWSGPCQR